MEKVPYQIIEMGNNKIFGPALAELFSSKLDVDVKRHMLKWLSSKIFDTLTDEMYDRSKIILKQYENRSIK